MTLTDEAFMHALFLIRKELDDLIDLINQNKLSTDGSIIREIKLEQATIIFNEDTDPNY